MVIKHITATELDAQYHAFSRTVLTYVHTMTIFIVLVQNWKQSMIQLLMNTLKFMCVERNTHVNQFVNLRAYAM